MPSALNVMFRTANFHLWRITQTQLHWKRKMYNKIFKLMLCFHLLMKNVAETLLEINNLHYRPPPCFIYNLQPGHEHSVLRRPHNVTVVSWCLGGNMGARQCELSLLKIKWVVLYFKPHYASAWLSGWGEYLWLLGSCPCPCQRFHLMRYIIFTSHFMAFRILKSTRGAGVPSASVQYNFECRYHHMTSRCI